MNADGSRFEPRLALLNRAASGVAWLSGHDLRRTAARRRRRRRLTGLTAAGVAALGVVSAVTIASRDEPGAAVRVVAGQYAAERSGPAVQLVAKVGPLIAAPDRAAEEAVARAEQGFTFDLLRQANLDGADDNVVFSPSSLALAVSMLQNGAAGETRQEIAKVLGTPGLTAAQQNAGWSALMENLGAAAKRAKISLQSANSLWLQQNLPMRQPFMSALAQYFHAGVWQVDFGRDLPRARKAIDNWAARHTEGKITRLFADEDIDRSTLLVLANAIYLKAAWKYEFDPKLTTPGAFRTAGGATTTVPFMTTSPHGHPLASAATAAYDAVQLPYSGGRFAALAVMPNGQDLTTFVDALTPARLGRISAGLIPQPVDLRLPRFTLARYTNLNETMKGLGMTTAFTDAADLSALSPVAMKVQSVVQRAFLRVDEKGTEAAAVSGISGVPTSAGKVLHIAFDRPFLFLIRDTATGAILFAAQVQNPSD